MTLLAITLAALLVLGYPLHRVAVRDRMQRDTIHEQAAELARVESYYATREGQLLDDLDDSVRLVGRYQSQARAYRQRLLDEKAMRIVAEYRAEQAETALDYWMIRTTSDNVTNLDAARLARQIARGRQAGAR